MNCFACFEARGKLKVEAESGVIKKACGQKQSLKFELAFLAVSHSVSLVGVPQDTHSDSASFTESLSILAARGASEDMRRTELKNDCACVTYDPVGGSSAGKSRLKQQIHNVKSITER